MSSTGPALDRFHYQNFIDAVRGKAPLNSPISEGHKSVTMLQLGNIAWRVGRDLKTDPANGHVLHDDEASKLCVSRLRTRLGAQGVTKTESSNCPLWVVGAGDDYVIWR